MPAPLTPIRIHFGTATAVDMLPEDDRRRLIETVQRLQATPPEDWRAEEITRANSPEPLYVLRLPPRFRVVLLRTEDGELEVQNIFTEEGLRIWREFEAKASGGPGNETEQSKGQ